MPKPGNNNRNSAIVIDDDNVKFSTTVSVEVSRKIGEHMYVVKRTVDSFEFDNRQDAINAYDSVHDGLNTVLQELEHDASEQDGDSVRGKAA